MTSRINTQRARMSELQEQITSGRRINRASDDPRGTEAVLNLRTSQAELAQFDRVGNAVGQKLTAADNAIDSYQTVVDRIRVLVTQGLSDTSTQAAKNALATEIESLRGRVLTIANTENSGDYLFGGTRQTEAPFDPLTGTASAVPASARYAQVEPGAQAIATGVTAETIFSDATATIFEDLDAAVAALRGTGDPVVDRASLEAASVRLSVYADQANAARAIVGSNMNIVEMVRETLAMEDLTLDERATDIEGADFAEAALGLAAAERSLEATLQIAARGRRSLFDFLG